MHELSVETLYAVVREVETATRRLAAVNAAALSAVDADGRWATDGSRSLAAWLRRATDGSPARAHRQVRTARALREHLPETAGALRAGAIGAEHADLIAKLTTSSPNRVTALGHSEVGEAFLVSQAEQLDAATFHRVLRRWSIAADPDAADRDHRERHDKEHLVLAKALDGYHLQGWLTDANGAVLDAALAARVGVPAAQDGRSATQRRAGALVSLARHALDSGTLTPGAAIRPHLSVHVPYDTLQRLIEAQAPGAAEAHDPAGPRAPDGARVSAGTRARTEPLGVAGTRGSPGGGSTTGTSASARPDAPRDGDEADRWPLLWRGPLPTACGADDGGARRTDGTNRSTPGSADGAGRPAGNGTARPIGAGRASRGMSKTDGRLVLPGAVDHVTLSGAAPAELDDGTPLPHGLLARLACDCEIARVVFGPRSEILDAGRSKRLFTPGQRRAIIARDRGCQYPGCDAPPGEGEIHHSIWWYAQHGHTRARDGVLLCWFHHDYVHAHQLSIERADVTDEANDGSRGHSGEPDVGGGPSGAIARTADARPRSRWVFRRANGRRVIAPSAPERADVA